MEKVDLIYDTVCRIEENMSKRLDKVECDIQDYKCFKARIIQGISLISLGVPLAIEAFKKKFF